MYRCPIDDTAHLHNVSLDMAAFSFRAFLFDPTRANLIYVRCIIGICESGNRTNSTCQDQCPHPRTSLGRFKREAPEGSPNFHLTFGPITIQGKHPVELQEGMLTRPASDWCRLGYIITLQSLTFRSAFMLLAWCGFAPVSGVRPSSVHRRPVKSIISDLLDQLRSNFKVL